MSATVASLLPGVSSVTCVQSPTVKVASVEPKNEWHPLGDVLGLVLGRMAGGKSASNPAHK